MDNPRADDIGIYEGGTLHEIATVAPVDIPIDPLVRRAASDAWPAASPSSGN